MTNQMKNKSSRELKLAGDILYINFYKINILLINLWPHETDDSNLHTATTEHMMQLSHWIWLDVVRAVPKRKYL